MVCMVCMAPKGVGPTGHCYRGRRTFFYTKILLKNHIFLPRISFKSVRHILMLGFGTGLGPPNVSWHESVWAM